MKQTTVAKVLAAQLRDGGSLLYAGAALLGAPYFLRRKRRLLQKGRSDIEFDPARWNIVWDADADDLSDDTNTSLRDTNGSFPDTNGSLRATSGELSARVAFVLASWGEVATMEPLIRAFRRERPDARVVISVERREAIVAARALSDEAVVPFPFDSPLPVARWHARARPDLVVFFEQFDFPTLTRSLWTRRVPFVIIQARVNAERGLGYQRRLANPKFKRWQLRGLGAMLISSPQQRDLIAPVVPESARLQVVGSLKFPVERPRIAPQREADLRAWIAAATGGAPLLVAGSTHESEEAFVLDALEIVRANYAGAAPVVLLAPRRLHRVEAVAQMLNERGVRVSRRSQPASGPRDVLLLDTMGELGVAYGCGVAAFVGGTVSGASHNVAEPLIWGVPVAYGPIRGNFAVEQQLCESAGVGFRVETPAELAAHWLELLQSDEMRDDLASRARALVAAQNSAFGRSLRALVEAVDAASRT